MMRSLNIESNKWTQWFVCKQAKTVRIICMGVRFSTNVERCQTDNTYALKTNASNEIWFCTDKRKTSKQVSMF